MTKLHVSEKTISSFSEADFQRNVWICGSVLKSKLTFSDGRFWEMWKRASIERVQQPFILPDYEIHQTVRQTDDRLSGNCQIWWKFGLFEKQQRQSGLNLGWTRPVSAYIPQTSSFWHFEMYVLWYLQVLQGQITKLSVLAHKLNIWPKLQHAKSKEETIRKSQPCHWNLLSC